MNALRKHCIRLIDDTPAEWKLAVTGGQHAGATA